MTYKARLVVHGFEDDMLSLEIDSHTCCKDTLHIVLASWCAKIWTLHSIDIKSAFLQGFSVQR